MQIKCPRCAYPIIVRNDATVAVCPKCGATFTINRPRPTSGKNESLTRKKSM